VRCLALFLGPFPILSRVYPARWPLYPRQTHTRLFGPVHQRTGEACSSTLSKRSQARPGQ
jgi:hypothetical protein